MASKNLILPPVLLQVDIAAVPAREHPGPVGVSVRDAAGVEGSPPARHRGAQPAVIHAVLADDGSTTQHVHLRGRKLVIDIKKFTYQQSICRTI